MHCTRVHERLREYTSISMRSLIFEVMQGAQNEIQRAQHRGLYAFHESPRAFTRVYKRFGMKEFLRI